MPLIGWTFSWRVRIYVAAFIPSTTEDLVGILISLAKFPLAFIRSPRATRPYVDEFLHCGPVYATIWKKASRKIEIIFQVRIKCYLYGNEIAGAWIIALFVRAASENARDCGAGEKLGKCECTAGEIPEISSVSFGMVTKKEVWAREARSRAKGAEERTCWLWAVKFPKGI